jgi:DNA-binding winged helix-turn-helix (wHTH) protein
MNGKNRVWHEEFHFDNCVIRSDMRELLRDGVAQKIERRSFDLLLYLLKLEGRVASKDELLEHVWGNRYVSDSVIAQSIMKVRKALGISGKEPGPIKTIHRVGYRFVGDVRRVKSSSEPSARSDGPPRILWLPTECPSTQAGLSWVRYGLISVASHILESQGVPTFPVGESIRLYESTDSEKPVHAIAARLFAQGADVGVVGSRLSAVQDQYQLEWQLHIDGVRSANSVMGESPAEMALMAAQEIALSVRVRSVQPVPPEPDARFWEEINHLLSLAEAMHQMHKMVPLLARCVELAQCPLRVMAEFLWLLAQHTDPSTPSLAERLTQRAHLAGEIAYEGWARLCLACFQRYSHQPDRARQQTSEGLALVRLHASGSLLLRSLLLASHIMATLDEHSEAHALLQETDQLIAAHPVGNLASSVQLQRCELACLGMEIAAQGQPFAAALLSAQRLGFQASVAWLQAFCGMQCCAIGDFDPCRLHLDASLLAGEQCGETRVHIYAILQLGSFFARTGDQRGLEQCLARLGDPALREAPFGTATWRWLRARHLLLGGHAADALPLAEQAMGELSDLGLWWPEDSWVFVAQAALMSGNRSVAQHMLGHLDKRRHRHPATARRATLLAVQGMLAYFDGDQTQALSLFQQAHELGRHTLMAQVLLLGLVWLLLVNGQQPTTAQLAASGHWSDRTREGQHVQALLNRGMHWGASMRQQTLMLGTGTDDAVSLVADTGDADMARYAECLPMPV